MISNRRSFLKNAVGVFGMIAGGALLPKVPDAPNKTLLVNGKEVAEYIEAGVFSNSGNLYVTLTGKEWERMRSLPMPFTWKERDIIELHNKGNIQEFSCVYEATILPTRHDTQATLSFDVRAKMF